LSNNQTVLTACACHAGNFSPQGDSNQHNINKRDEQMVSISRITTSAVLGAALSLGAAQASAGDDHWGYVGASYGNAQVKIQDSRISDWDSSWKVFSGYMFNENIGAELTYHDMGNASDGDFRVADLTGVSAQVIGVLPLGSFDLFAKVGYMYHDAEFEIGAGTPTNNGVELAAGFGARYKAGKFGIRAEAEAFDVSFADLYVLSIGAEYRF